MNWRRGVLLAGIHLAIAALMTAWDEAPYWHTFRSEAPASQPILRLAVLQEDQSISFNPCEPGGFLDREMSPMEFILASEIAPLALIGFGHIPCSTASSLEGLMESHFGARTRRSEVAIGVNNCLAIAVLWFAVGGFPLIRPRRWWLEPGALITAGVVISANALIIAGLLQLLSMPGAHTSFEAVGLFCRITAGAALLTWLVWFGLLVSKLLRSGWHLLARLPFARAN